jgi:4-amino-4-deoxy-L-arabinose transferase-like glycosyltransferase
MRLPVARWVLVLLALVAFAVALDNMSRRLANPDEGRYSEISREMAASGDWVTPRLNGIKYFEKPPLQYWATAAAFRLFGENEFAARLYILACGLGTILVIGFAALRLWNADVALATMLTLVASPYFLALGGIVTLDMGLTLWTTLTLCGFLLAERAVIPAEAGSQSSTAHRRWMLVAWAAMALAVLSKGLVGIVFPVAAIGLQALARRDFSFLWRLEHRLGIVVFLAIAAPWFVLVGRANPEFNEFFFFHEHFSRFLTKTHRRVEPWWYFVPIVIFGFLPWMFALPSAIAHAWRRESGQAFQPLRLCLLWSAFIVVFFSASGSKLPTYVLPAFPTLALAVATFLVDADQRRLARFAALGMPAGLAIAWFGWHYPNTANDAWSRVLYEQAQPFAVAGGVVAFVSSAAATFFFVRGRRWHAVTTMAFAGALLIGCIVEGYKCLTPRQSGYEVAQKMKPLLAGSPRLYAVNHYDQTLPFYLGRTLTLVDYGDEFETGLTAEPEHGIAELDRFVADWQRPGEALAIMQPGIVEKLKTRHMPMEVLHQDPRRILVRKP